MDLNTRFTTSKQVEAALRTLAGKIKKSPEMGPNLSDQFRHKIKQMNETWSYHNDRENDRAERRSREVVLMAEAKRYKRFEDVADRLSRVEEEQGGYPDAVRELVMRQMDDGLEHFDEELFAESFKRHLDGDEMVMQSRGFSDPGGEDVTPEEPENAWANPEEEEEETPYTIKGEPIYFGGTPVMPGGTASVPED